MSKHRRHLFHAVATFLVCSLVAGALVVLGGAPAEAKVPRMAFRYTAAIEPLARYVGQSTCSPAAKPGTTAFANLLLRTYPNSRSLGISRSCSVGGRSEHKEGRAFDWGVSVRSATDRASVQALMEWLLRPDRFGNRNAMARRLGIQYMIWNRRIWGAYAASSGWRRYTGANPHTDHVHFSLSWTGARKRTSFWNPRDFPRSSGSAPSTPRPPSGDGGPGQPSGDHDWPDPQPDEDRRLPQPNPEPRAPGTLLPGAPVTSERLRVPTGRRAGVLTQGALVDGHRYLIEMSGTYRYSGAAGAIADGECSTRAGADWWQRDRSLHAEQWWADHLDLYVDGEDLLSQADDGQSCTPGHTYRWLYEPDRTGRVPFAVWDPNRYDDNRGALSVHVLDLATVRDSMTWQVPARNVSGTTSPGLLRGGQRYRVTVSGTWSNGGGGTADAECLSNGGGPWRRDDDGYDMVIGEWHGDGLVPSVTGVRSMPLSGAPECDGDHRYSFDYQPSRTGPLNIRVTDPGPYDDNTGALTVSVAPAGGSPAPSPAPAPAPAPSPSPSPTPRPSPTPAPTPSPTPAPTQEEPERLWVDAKARDAVRTQTEYAAGTSLRVTVTGRYHMRYASDWIVADAECTITSTSLSWQPTRFDGDFAGRHSPLGDLAVNGEIVTWNPSDGRGSCDARNNRYTYDMTVGSAGPVWFVVADSYYDDNAGGLNVEVAVR